MDSSAFNTLFSKNVPHLLEKIFFSLDYKSYKTCLEVSKVWNDLLTSDSFQMKGKSVFQTELLKDGVELFKTAWEGDTDKVQKLLSIGIIDVNIDNFIDLRTPLMAAAFQGHTNIVQLLFDSGADLNKADRDGFTPLHHAAANGKIDTVRLLIDLGAEAQLTKLANNGDTATIRVLLDAGSNPNMTELNGDFPLLRATIEDYKGLVQLLLQRRAKPNMRNQYGTTPLHFAAGLGHKDVVKQLIDGGAELNSTDIWGCIPLYYAVLGGNKEVVKLLLDMGADQNIANEEGKTPLTLACEKDYLDIVSILTDQEPANLPNHHHPQHHQ